MPQRAKATATDRVFGALANPTRRDILALLLEGSQPVQAIADHFDMARPSVSEHLKVLRDCGLVSEEKHGRHRYYRINPDPLHDLQSWLSPYERYWRQHLTKLGEMLDTMSDDEEGGEDA
ncbi:ArsR/SmtB family transcription factor [Nocardia donostiensis]|uniref:Transcriptional regulator n=1 Tax=Nocardia donostiensis TaxID=1538463 RepID=A0A1V2TGF3_9NOCA|nr:metalloregulator ArsR/SmtB family transcription factor [Nocardia donostiensis]ONM48599.1 transcriptional regulator [Nocardia donostiensis]OQS16788.1 transcriptional regulator [Nocardia donostiensis]OQS23253.1 transcriptional regulator [Nocardia donostiensis]